MSLTLLLTALAAGAAWLFLRPFQGPGAGRRNARILALGSLLATLLSCGIGFLTMALNMQSLSGALSVFRGRPAQCSFIGACLGFCLIFLREGETRKGAALALCGTVCLMRLAEFSLPPVGLGFVWEGPLSFFPFTVKDEYGDPCLAVFALEAIFALTIALTLLRQSRREGEAGLRWGSAWLLAGQIFWENLRSATLRVGFVRVEQVLCAGILLCLIWFGAKGHGRWRRSTLALLLIAGIGLLEFIMDKPYLLADLLVGSGEMADRLSALLLPLCHALTALICIVLARLAALPASSPREVRKAADAYRKRRRTE